jgi:hypothetical protein
MKNCENEWGRQLLNIMIIISLNIDNAKGCKRSTITVVNTHM